MNNEAIKTLNSRIKNITHAIEYEKADYDNHIVAITRSIIETHNLEKTLAELQESVELLKNA